jgi:transcriptional regulator with XRE-family HTH domain
LRPTPIEPRPDRRAIGSRIRATRQARQMTIDQLSQVTGLSKGFISRVERDQTSPSVSTLVQICDVLHISVGDLFHEPDSHLTSLERAPRINLGGEHVTEYLLSPRSERRCQIVLTVVDQGETGSGGDELYTINCEVDVLTVLSGEVDFNLNGNHWSLKAGDTLTFSGREPHTWRSADPSVETRIMWTLIPAPWNSGF